MSASASELIEQAGRARREERLEDAHRDFAQAVALCRESGLRRELVRALKGLGQIESDLGRLDRARPLYEEAVANCRLMDDDLSLAHTVRHLGDIHRHAGDLRLAEPCYREALALYRQHEETPPLDLANALRPLAILKEQAGDVQEAKLLWTEARDLYGTVGVQVAVLECSARLARLASQEPAS
jgi:tetratricopeptide (TPR) repeat protein